MDHEWQQSCRHLETTTLNSNSKSVHNKSQISGFPLPNANMNHGYGNKLLKLRSDSLLAVDSNFFSGCNRPKPFVGFARGLVLQSVDQLRSKRSGGSDNKTRG